MSRPQLPPAACRRLAPVGLLVGTTLLGASLGASLGGCAGEADAPVRPPVVLILFDALGASHVSHLGYGRETTPVLDEIAAGGWSFENCIVPAPYTTASVPSLHTGRHPDAHGVVDGAFQLREDERTLAEHLLDAGWSTQAAVSQPNAGSQMGNDQGFESFVELWIADDPAQAEYRFPRRGLFYNLVSADEVIDCGIEMLAARDDRPPFLYLHVLEPHTPFEAPDPWRDRWVDPAYDGPFLERGTEGLLIESLNGRLELDEGDREHVRALYDGNLAWADHNLGRMRDALRAEGLWDEALVVITSDHGEAHWEHGSWGHNWQLYEEFVRVPLVLKPPASWGLDGGRVERMVSTLDLAPTLLELLGVELASPYDLDGISLAGLLTGTGLPDDTGGRGLVLRSSHTAPYLALRDDGRKTIQRPGSEPAVEHYDLTQDPSEAQDLAALGDSALGPRLERLRERIRELRAAGEGVPAVVQERDRALLERLGYLEDEE